MGRQLRNNHHLMDPNTQCQRCPQGHNMSLPIPSGKQIQAMATEDGVSQPSGRQTTLPLHNRPQYSHAHRNRPSTPGRSRNLVGQPHIYHTHTIHTHHHKRRRMPNSHPTIHTSQPHPTNTHPPLGTQNLQMRTNRKTLPDQTPLPTFRRRSRMG